MRSVCTPYNTKNINFILIGLFTLTPHYSLLSTTSVQTIKYETIETQEEKTIEDSVENAVREEFKDIPILIAISKCESGFRQYNPDGSVFKGITNDYGVMQIAPQYHLENAKKMGMNIETLNGNMEYARYLYNNFGTEPWNASKKVCWQK